VALLTWSGTPRLSPKSKKQSASTLLSRKRESRLKSGNCVQQNSKESSAFTEFLDMFSEYRNKKKGPDGIWRGLPDHRLADYFFDFGERRGVPLQVKSAPTVE
jgi:hypothetical protein